MAVRLILSVVVGLALSLSPAAYAMKQLELKSHSHIAAIDIPLSGKEKAWLAAQPTLTVGTRFPRGHPSSMTATRKVIRALTPTIWR